MVVALSVFQCVLFYLSVSVVFSCLFCLAVRSFFGSVLSFPFPFAFYYFGDRGPAGASGPK